MGVLASNGKSGASGSYAFGRNRGRLGFSGGFMGTNFQAVIASISDLITVRRVRREAPPKISPHAWADFRHKKAPEEQANNLLFWGFLFMTIWD
jgi:hypothetical protein